MTTSDLQKMHALENQIAATADDERAPLVAALKRLVAQAEDKGVAVPAAPDTLDEDFFDNMPV
jgi:hypothetical protein